MMHKSLFDIERHELPANPQTFTIDRKLEAQEREINAMCERFFREALELKP